MFKKVIALASVGAALLVASQAGFAHGKHGQYDTDHEGYLKSGDGTYVLDGFGNCVAYTKMPKAGPKGCLDGQVAKPAPKAPAKPVVAAPVDGDRDGVVDAADQCKATPAGAEVDAVGCEVDSDYDGVVDSKDRCANTQAGAKVDSTGCYIVLKEAKNIELNVKFPSGSSVVPTSYYNEIEQVANFMKQYPNTSVVVEGHTDSQGAASFNKSLSQKRANAIAALLTSNYGISGTRVSAIGYGEERPIASNATRDGRATNRRVVAVINTVVEKIAK